MSIIAVFSVFAVLSLFGIAFLLGRRIAAAKILGAEEQKLKFHETPLFFEFARTDIIQPFEAFVANTVQPALLKIGEKTLRRCRLLILKIENMLHRLSDHFRGRRIAIKNGNGNNSEFWHEMQEAKKEAQNGDDKNKNQPA